MTFESLYELLCIVCWIGNLGRVFSSENTPEGGTEMCTSSFCPCQPVSGRNGDHE